jgi:Uncharacterized protein conserved in bacteria N-term (DUF3322)
VWVDGYLRLWKLLGVGREPARFAELVNAACVVAPAVADWRLERPHEVLTAEPVWPRLLDSVLWIDALADPDL